MHPGRLHVLAEPREPRTPGPLAPVVYWMHRDHRCRDNWGLTWAQEEAVRNSASLAAAWCLAPQFLGAAYRQYAFLIKGLRQTAAALDRLHIPLLLLQGEPGVEIPALLQGLGAALLVTDFDPLRVKRQWVADTAQAFAGRSVEIDSRNCVPCRAASDKREYAARTIRPKLLRLLPDYLEPCPEPRPHPVSWPHAVPAPDWDALLGHLTVDRTVAEVTHVAPGEDAAIKALDAFLDQGLARYAAGRNDPNARAQSGLSPWLHFGMLSPLAVVTQTLARSPAGDESREAFLEELVVRRELADNFCLHAPSYDSIECFPDWALRTLDKHRNDPRERLYTLEELAAGRTADPLWNAAQLDMVLNGSMPGYLRMYWAKKILEWSASPEAAMAAAVVLNDRYQLDGRDSNGYAGIAWSMGGVHDRPWKERPVFGTIRYMNLAGCRRKFDVDAYVARIAAQATGKA